VRLTRGGPPADAPVRHPCIAAVEAAQPGDVLVIQHKQPGDHVLADGSGVVFVPAAEIGRVLDAAEMIAAREAAMSRDVEAGQRVSQVMGAAYEHMLRPAGG
jgi:regulator of RNase E activity RraA